MLKKIRVFLKVVELKSFTAASLEMGISESAVSQSIKSLEEDVGVKLLVREKRSFYLTHAGEYLSSNAKTLLSEFDLMLANAKRLGEEDDNSISIAYPLGYEGKELREAVLIFSNLYPDVKISLYSGTHEEIYTLLRNDDADVILNDQRRAFSDEFENIVLEKGAYYLFLPPNHPISLKEDAEIDDLIYTPIIVISSKGDEKSEEDYYKRSLNIKSPSVFARNLEIARLMRESGKGYLLAMDGGDGKTMLKRDGKPVFYTFCVFYKKSRSFYYTEEFAKILKEVFDKKNLSH